MNTPVGKKEMRITVMSFGFKHGMPEQANLLLDVRFLPNPFWVETLRPMCGLDRPVQDYIFSFPQTSEFMERAEALLDSILPQYAEKGTEELTLTIGCTGGHHRSVAVASALSLYLQQQGYNSVVLNRDLTL